MPNYLIECYLPRSRSGDLPATVDRLRGAADALTAAGAPVRHVRSTFLPGDELCLHLLEAESAETAGEASRRAAIDAARVVPAWPVPSTHPSGGAP